VSASQPNDHHKEREYDSAIHMANNPLTILNNIKKGDLTISQMQHFTAMYPELYNQLSKKMTEHVIKAQLKGDKPNYKLRQSLSMFLKAPLDSSFTPQAIQAAQSTFAQPQAPQGQAPVQNKKGTSSLGKFSKDYKTSGQALEGRKQRDR